MEHTYTHHGIEDIGIMRVLPNMEIYTPFDLNSLDYIFKRSIKALNQSILGLRGVWKIDQVKKKNQKP